MAPDKELPAPRIRRTVLLGSLVLAALGVPAWLAWRTPPQEEGERRVLRGTPIAGNAWTHYRRAVELSKNEADASEVLAAIRRGAQSEVADGPQRFRADGTVWLGQLDILAYWSAVDSASKHAIAGVEGDPREAAAALMDCALLGRDMAELGSLLEQLSGMLIVGHAISETAARCALATWSAADLDSLGSELAVLERSLPDMAMGYEWEWRFIEMALTKSPKKLREAGLGDSREDLGDRLSFLIATTTLGPSALEVLRPAWKRLGAATKLPWSEALVAFETSHAELSASSNLIVQVWKKPSLDYLAGPRRAVANIRMLRQLVEALAVGSAPASENPFGGIFEIEDSIYEIRASGRGGTSEERVTLAIPRS